MILVVPKAEPREAWQYTGRDGAFEWPLWVLNTTGWRGGNEEDLVLKRRSGLQVINLTDWLIRDLDGDSAHLTDAQKCAEFDEIVRGRT